mgnify:CR=1 FL=1
MLYEVEVNGGILSKDELDYYKKYISDKYPQVKKAVITVDGDYVDLDFCVPEIKFSRIRRVTGYLVGSMDRWNDAKRAEEHDRVKHQKV